jgi:mevalonate kinase
MNTCASAQAPDHGSAAMDPQRRSISSTAPVRVGNGASAALLRELFAALDRR